MGIGRACDRQEKATADPCGMTKKRAEAGTSNRRSLRDDKEKGGGGHKQPQIPGDDQEKGNFGLGRVSGGVEHLAGDGFGGEVQVVGGGAEGYGTVFVEGEGLIGAVAGGLLLVGEAGPAGVDTEDDLFGTDFHDRVLRAGEAVGGGVDAEHGSPGGPEFGLEARIIGHFNKFRIAISASEETAISTPNLNPG